MFSGPFGPYPKPQEAVVVSFLQSSVFQQPGRSPRKSRHLDRHALKVRLDLVPASNTYRSSKPDNGNVLARTFSAGSSLYFGS